MAKFLGFFPRALCALLIFSFLTPLPSVHAAPAHRYEGTGPQFIAGTVTLPIEQMDAVRRALVDGAALLVDSEQYALSALTELDGDWVFCLYYRFAGAYR